MLPKNNGHQSGKEIMKGNHGKSREIIADRHGFLIGHEEFMGFPPTLF